MDKEDVIHIYSEILLSHKKRNNTVSFPEISDQISSSVVSYSLQPQRLQHARPPCLSPTPGVHSNSCPLSRWCRLQASLSITNSWSSLRLTSIESVMPSSHLILCHPLLLLPPIPSSIRVFSNESDCGTPLQYSCLENLMDRGAW